MTVSEMLVLFRGYYKFRVYMKSKPERYEIKIQCFMMQKLFIYSTLLYIIAKKIFHDKRSVLTRTVMKLVEPIYTDSNITGDNWFLSIELV